MLVTRISWRQRAEPDIDFGICDLDAQGSEALQVGGLRGQVGGISDNKMALQSYTVDLDAASLECCDNVLRSGGFGARVFNVVVIIIKLDIRIILSCRFECNGDVLCSDLGFYQSDVFPGIGPTTYRIVEHVRSVGTIIVESFIYHIPAIALAFIVSNFTLNMGLEC